MTFVLAVGLALLLGGARAADQAANPEHIYSSVTDPDVERPMLIESIRAIHTPEAKAAQLVGMIVVHAIVRADASVTDVNVVESCLVHPGSYPWPGKTFFQDVIVRDFRGWMLPERCQEVDRKARDMAAATGTDPSLGLNDEAVKAAARWAFRPARKAGIPVAYHVQLGFTFGLEGQ